MKTKHALGCFVGLQVPEMYAPSIDRRLIAAIAIRCLRDGPWALIAVGEFGEARLKQVIGPPTQIWYQAPTLMTRLQTRSFRCIANMALIGLIEHTRQKHVIGKCD